MGKGRGTVPSPRALAINVCNDLSVNEQSGTLDLLGCFTVIRASEFPTIHPSIFVHLDLTNGHGIAQISLSLYPTDFEENPILEITATVDFSNPCEIRQVCFELGEVYFEAAGEYTITIHCNDDRLTERRIFLALEQ